MKGVPAMAELRNTASLCAAAFLAALAAAPATARGENWLDRARLGQTGIAAFSVEPPPRPASVDTRPLNLESGGYALEHGFDVIEIQHYAFFGLHTGGIFNYQPDALIYVPPAAGTSDRGHGQVSLAPMAVWLRPNYALYGSHTHPFGHDPLLGPLTPASSLLTGASPRVLHFESRGR
jgi:hypothetical protein